MTVSRASFLTRFPEFIPHPEGIVDGAIAEATADVGDGVFGDQSDRAIKHLSAHIIAIQLAQMGIQVGATEGKVYGKGLDATQYGQEFKRMLETVSAASCIGFVA
jgi:hypothetical protein